MAQFGDPSYGLSQGSRSRRRLHLSLQPLEERAVLAAQHPLLLGDLLPQNGGDGSLGFATIGGRSYTDVASAGDFNGDGFDDLIIGSNGDHSGPYTTGSVFIVFGSGGRPGGMLDLEALDGSNGFRIDAPIPYYHKFESVSPAGDLNGDGCTDLVFGTNTNEVHVVFGRSQPMPATLNLRDLDGVNGFHMHTVAPRPFARAAGDFNGDGLDDFWVGDYPVQGQREARAFLVFGRTDGYPVNFDLGTLDGSNGIVAAGTAVAHHELAGGGDFNGDGYGDVVISGQRSFVLMGRPNWGDGVIDLINSPYVIEIRQLDRGDYVEDVNFIGDLNGDGYDDLAVGAVGAGSGVDSVGAVFVVFGRHSISSSIDLGALNGSNGFRLDGVQPGGRFGGDPASAGDLNADGHDDLIVSATWAHGPSGEYAGQVFVLLGRKGGYLPRFEVGSLDGTNGYRIEGPAPHSTIGRSLDASGDFDGDGFDDLLISTSYDGRLPGPTQTAHAFLVWGNDLTETVTMLGAAEPDMLLGSPQADVLVGAQGSDLLIGNGGRDVLRGGQGHDVLAISDTTFLSVDGGSGTDTLRFDGGGLALDLVQPGIAGVSDIEIFDIRGDGSNRLRLGPQQVLNLSPLSNSVVVLADADDLVDIGGGWTVAGTEVVDGQQLTVYRQGNAALKVRSDVLTQFSSLSGFVYLDGNNNGLYEPELDDWGIAGVEVVLSGKDWTGQAVLVSTRTNEAGAYYFVNLAPSDPDGYTVSQVQPLPYRDGIDRQGTPGTGDTIEDRFTGIQLASGIHGQNNNFGELLLPLLRVEDVTKSEGNAGTVTFTVPVTLTYAANSDVVVHFVVANGTAVDGEDYIAPAPQTITFAPGETRKEISITVLGDTIDEDNDDFFVRLSDSVGAILADDEARVEIRNDDLRSIIIEDGSATEGDEGASEMVFSVFLSGPTFRVVTATFSTFGSGLATAGKDYVATSVSLTFAPGETRKDITVSVLGDTLPEPAESFQLRLDWFFNASFNYSKAIVGVIYDDDPLRQLSVSDATVVEGGDGTRPYAVFDVTLSQPLPFAVHGSYLVSPDTAQSWQDYRVYTIPGYFSIPAGETLQRISVAIVGDSLYEADETFHLEIFSNEWIERKVGVGTIIDDDLPTVLLETREWVEGDEPREVAIPVQLLSNPSNVPLVFSYEVQSGSAQSGEDFLASSGQLTFLPGQLTAVVPVTLLGDTVSEADESFVLRLTSEAGVETSFEMLIDNDDSDPRMAVTGDATIRVFPGSAGAGVLEIVPFTRDFSGGVRVAMGDVNGDGFPDLIAAAGPGGGPHVRVFDGLTGAPLTGPAGDFFAYDIGFAGGVFVASADLDGDGHDDIITGAGAGGGPHVRVFSGADGHELMSFFAYNIGFTGGVHVAAGDVDGDGTPDIVTGAGAGGGPHVMAFSGANGDVVRSFFAYNLAFTGGVYVASGDVNGDLYADIYTGAGASGGPHVRVVSGLDGADLHNFFAYNLGFSGGVRVAAGDLDGDGLADVITGAGPGGGPHVRGLSGQSLIELTSLFAYDAAFTSGVFVAGSTSVLPPATLRLAAQHALAGAVRNVSVDELTAISAAAIQRWSQAGLPERLQQRLRDTRLMVADLPGDLLGIAVDDRIVIDLNAAGQGWFIDPTPMTDEEFSLPEAMDPSATAVDLLSVVMHEFGHRFHLDDIASDLPDELMSDLLGAGIRRIPHMELFDQHGVLK